MDRLDYTNVVSQLRRSVPEIFASEELFYEDLPHDVFGSLGLALCQWLRQPSQVDVVRRTTRLLCKMAESDNDDIVNLLEVSVFEVICDDEECCAMLQEQLSPTASNMLRTVCRRLHGAT
jgi:hypothetical protein